jgi:threonine dehydrogenase-like Zn-dependent dehydrogenase
VQPTLACGTCAPCTSGAENVCVDGGFIGLSGGGGGLSDSVVVSCTALHDLPAHIPLDVGALVEPLSVAWHAAAAAPLSADSSVLILGGGPIGLALVQVLRARGVRKVLVSEISAARQRFAREFGAHHVFNPKVYDAVALSKSLSGGGDGVDVVFDCAGVKASIATACAAVRARGCVVNVAIWEGEVGWNPNSLVFKEAEFRAVLGYTRADVAAVIAGIADGKLRPGGMITGRIALEDVVECGIKALVGDKERHVKILVEVGGMQRVDSAVH